MTQNAAENRKTQGYCSGVPLFLFCMAVQLVQLLLNLRTDLLGEYHPGRYHRYNAQRRKNSIAFCSPPVVSTTAESPRMAEITYSVATACF